MHLIDEQQAIDYIFQKLCESGLAVEEIFIWHVLNYFSEYLQEYHPEIEVEVEEDV